MNHLSSDEKCSRTNSHSTHHALRLIKLFFSEVEPHYFSTTWESLYPVPWEILLQLLNPSVLQAPCFHCSKETQSLDLLSPRRWQASTNSAAMSCGGWFLRSLFNCESAHEEKALLISTGWITIDWCQPSCVCGWSTFTNYIWIDQNSFPSFFENNWSTQAEYRIRALTQEVWHTSHLQEWIFTTSNRRTTWNPLIRLTEQFKSIISCFFFHYIVVWISSTCNNPPPRPYRLIRASSILSSDSVLNSHARQTVKNLWHTFLPHSSHLPLPFHTI